MTQLREFSRTCRRYRQRSRGFSRAPLLAHDRGGESLVKTSGLHTPLASLCSLALYSYPLRRVRDRHTLYHYVRSSVAQYRHMQLACVQCTGHQTSAR